MEAQPVSRMAAKMTEMNDLLSMKVQFLCNQIPLLSDSSNPGLRLADGKQMANSASTRFNQVMYILYIGNKNYSSWSLRPWVLLEAMGIEFEERLECFEEAGSFDKFRAFSPSGMVPCLVDDGTVVWDSLAICEYLAERHTGAWPEEPERRALARSFAAEMHSGFSSLREICPMNCAIHVELSEITPPLQKDIDRIEEIFAEGLERFGGPYLVGDCFSVADAFYCPVAIRIRSYQLPVSDRALGYVNSLLDLPAMRRWDQAAIAESWREEHHEKEAAAVGRIILDRRSP